MERKVDMTNRSSTAAPILAVLAVVLPLVLVGVYAGGYFWLCDYAEWPEGADDAVVIRGYKSAWLSAAFEPATTLESFVRKRQVWLRPFSDDSSP